jgi:hypothetical protein
MITATTRPAASRTPTLGRLEGGTGVKLPVGPKSKAISVLAVLAAVGCTVAGCGSSTKSVGGPLVFTGTTTISNVKAGTLIRCEGGPAAKVPHWFGYSYLRVPGVSGVIEMNHRHRSLTVRCKR